jgi:hypothetical protein
MNIVANLKENNIEMNDSQCITMAISNAGKSGKN